MPKVSIIIPVYGVEKYIDHCARSLFEQTLEDIEYIFVDDCTKDNSIAVLEHVIEDYPNRKSQITILHHDINKGLPQARKTGILVAKGEYIAHCDSDDWVDKDIYEVIYNEAITKKADLVFCDYYISTDRGDSDICVFTKNIRNCSKSSLLRKALVESTINPLWSLLAKRSLYRDICYPVGAQSEDKTFVIQLCYFSENAVYLKRPLYHYRQAPNSISHSDDISSIKKRYQQLYDNREIILDFMKRQGIVDGYKNELQAYLFETRSLLNSHLDNHECRQLWINSYPEAVKGMLFNKYIPIRSKILYYKNMLLINTFNDENINSW